MWQESCRTFRSADELPHLPLVFNKCDCGYEYDRDIHAARNVKIFGSTKRTECLEQASAENSSSTSLLTEMLDDLQEDSMKRKSEADTL